MRLYFTDKARDLPRLHFNIAFFTCDDMAPVISPSRNQQVKQKGPVTAAELVAQYKRKGIFDQKRRKLLQDFNGSVRYLAPLRPLLADTACCI